MPEGLLPTITLALAVGVRGPARMGAVVKRLSAVETLGSTDVLCTDKTGTLTENRMRVAAVRAGDTLRDPAPSPSQHPDPALCALAVAAAACDNAGPDAGDPTEVVPLRLAADLGVTDPGHPGRRAQFPFGPKLRLMPTVDERDGRLWLHAKGAPEEVLRRCTRTLGAARRRKHSLI